MKIGKHLLAGLLTVALALPLAAQDKQYDVKLHVYPQEQKAEPGAKQKKEKPRSENQKEMERGQARGQRPETTDKPATTDKPVMTDKAGCCEEAAACPMGHDGKMQGDQPCCKMQGDQPCCKMQDGQCCMMQGGGMQRPMGKGQQGMRPMGHGGGMPFMNSVQYREFRRRQLADFEGNRFYLGTNTLALVVGMPNINAEWRRNESFGVRLSVGGSFWSWASEDISIGGFWINPEVRWYLGETKGWYAGPMAKVGHIGVDGERRTSIAFGASLGYMQRVSKKFAVDYNVGVGFSAVGHDYADAYYLNGVYYSDGGTEWNVRFAPLKIGISLVWQTCSKPYGR